jgi:hypothetical protein
MRLAVCFLLLERTIYQLLIKRMQLAVAGKPKAGCQ